MKISQYSFQSIFISKNAIHGYVYNVDLEKNRKTKYLNFIIQTEGDIHNCQLFNRKESSQHIGVKIKKIKSSTKSDALQVTDFTKIKKQKLELELRTMVLTIINEIRLNKTVHIEEVLFSLKVEKVKFKDGRNIRIQ